ncbi:hypothetical protein CDAR_168881 [Caerostris darwini]|uniref:Uncharacterized protein n=1 Tax=Caerostris darwini TaxID=1538125 RepID=A0AAV4WPD2_9ARAC|nr:hypothetical protein CDAR_168881 [Caerostris darwini]
MEHNVKSVLDFNACVLLVLALKYDFSRLFGEKCVSITQDVYYVVNVGSFDRESHRSLPPSTLLSVGRRWRKPRLDLSTPSLPPFEKGVKVGGQERKGSGYEARVK